MIFPWIRRLLYLTLVPLLAAQDNPTPPRTAAPAEEVLRPPEPGRFKRLFQPLRTDTAALSPDGRHLAYSIRDGDSLSVAVVEIDHPEKLKSIVKVIDDGSATPMMSANQSERTPGRINWMRWSTSNRVVVETNRVYTENANASEESTWQNWTGAVLAFDADGGNARQLVGPKDVYETNLTVGDRYSIRREKDLRKILKFNDRVRLPDETVNGQVNVLNGAGGPQNSSASDDPFAPRTPTGSLDGEAPKLEDPVDFLPAAGATTLPRNFRVFDLDAARPGAVTLVATGYTRDNGNRLMGFYSLDATSGKLTNLVDEFVLALRTPRIDRQGRVRLALPNSLLTSFPLTYAYLGPKGTDRARPIDEATGLRGFTVSPGNYFAERAIPFGFDENPDILYYASNIDRDTYGIYSWDFGAAKPGPLALENPAYDLVSPPNAGFPDLDNLVFDRFTHQLAGVRYEGALRATTWLQPRLQRMQQELEKRFPGRGVEIREWDEAGRRFLFRTEGPADAGAFYLYDDEQGKLMEFVRRAPWIDANQGFATLPFGLSLPDGTRLAGLITVPHQPRMKPIPMVVVCPDTPWQRVHSDFQTEVQALADMGFAVVQYSGRGAWGLGLKQREAITAGYDLIQIEDLVATITHLEKLFAVNPRRVALLGRGHGGFIALRALQEHPGKFRCAVTLDVPVNLADWLAEQRWSDEDVRPHLTRAWLGDTDRLRAAPLSSNPEKLTKPVLMLSYPGPDGQQRRSGYVAARSFASSVRRTGGTVEFFDLPMDYMRGLPAARAEVFDRIEEFLNVNVYDFNVKMRDIKILKETKP